MILWPFYPNWSTEYRETYAYLTEVITSDSGKEQRRSWRVAARRRVEYAMMSPRSRFQALRRTTRRQSEVVVFPDEVRRARTSTFSAMGSTASVFQTPLPTWLASGRSVIFEHRQTRERVQRTVDSVASGTVVFTTAADRDWLAGTRVMPALVGTMADDINATAVTDRVSTGSVRLEVEPGTEIETPGAAVTLYRGLEVLTHRPNWSKGVDIESSIGRIWTDFDMGVRQATNPIAFTTDVFQRAHQTRSPEQLDQVLGLFQRSQGMRGEFYAPTCLDDFSLHVPTASGSTTFVVPGHEFYDAYNADTVYRCFCVRMWNDDLHFFRIVTMTKSGSGTPRTIITVDNPAPEQIDSSNVKSISWMPVCRFASDEMTLVWTTDVIAEIMVNLQTLEDLT